MAVGIALGLLLCRTAVLWQAQLDLGRYATQLLRLGEEAAAETQRVLREANASPVPFCSDADIARLRALAFRSRYIKGVGRLREGMLACSGTLGRLPAPLALPPPSLTGPAGLRIHSGISLAMAPQLQATVIQSGNASVVMGTDIYGGVVPAPFGYTVAVADRDAGRIVRGWGDELDLPASAVLQGGALNAGGFLYRSACSPQVALCAVTRISVAEALARAHTAFWLFGVLGGALALAAVQLGVMLWGRQQPLERRLRRAIRQGGLTVVYQPIVDLHSGAAVGAEALVRWRNEQGLPISAEVFVKVAEDRGFIGEITRFVLRDALGELGAMLQRVPGFRINVNVAPSDITESWLLDELRRNLRAARVPPGQIGLELTERSTAERAVAVDAIARLRQAGHRVYIDDFGTGYSSLSYLNELNVDALKIDRSFTRTVRPGAEAPSIVPQIVEMARALNLDVVVEGIETAGQAEYFRAMGGQIRGQGRYFAHPMNARDLLAWVYARRPPAPAPAAAP
ncbi:EAL domain-containing protein [Pigmentiphaga soli]|uniref:cyclic-guanylate-specific phosphodiesterase n=2 Tax=Pigmentiphaga soli TaxID=1007095 RepID=A0ABP8GUQ2_9BURK